MNEAQRKKFEEEFQKEYDSFTKVFEDDGDFAKHFFERGYELAVLSVSDGLEHSQHKCGCEEEIAELKRQLDGATFVQKKWDEREEVIKAYREALELIRDTDDLDDFSHDTAKEVLARMEGQ